MNSTRSHYRISTKKGIDSGSWWKNRMCPTNPQKDLKSRKGSKPCWGTASERFLFCSYTLRFTTHALRLTVSEMAQDGLEEYL